VQSNLRRELAEQHEIQGFPTIKFFKEMIPMEYTGVWKAWRTLFLIKLSADDGRSVPIKMHISICGSLVTQSWCLEQA
jgi:hypothetical protein